MDFGYNSSSFQSSPTLTNTSNEELWSNFAIPEDSSSKEPVKEESGVFNISWGGNDKPPTDIHPKEEKLEEPIKLSRPLPKPRGIRKLPEPEPAPDGTIDQDTLKRRKVTSKTFVVHMYS